MSEAISLVLLCVDDDHDILELYRHHLGSDYTVVTAASGQQGLDIVQQQKPSLILMDVMMPGMDGYRVCELLQSNPDTAYIPVVFISALGQEEDIARAHAVGGVDYLQKPFTGQQLGAVVSKHLQTRETWRQAREYVPRPKIDVQPGQKSFQQYLCDQTGLEERDSVLLLKAESSSIYQAAQKAGLAEHVVAQKMAEYKGLKYIELINPNSLLLGVLPTPFSRNNNVVVFRDEKGKDAVAVANPLDMLLQDSLENALEQRVLDNMHVAELAVIRDLFQKHDVSYVIDRMIALAVRKQKSTIELTPTESWFKITLADQAAKEDLVQLTNDMGIKVVSRLKVMGGMMGQSLHKEIIQGAYSLVVDGNKYALQLSSQATTHGEALTVFIPELASGNEKDSSEKESAPAILIVDDDREHNQLVEQILTKAGYSVLSVTDGVDALMSLGKEDFVLVLADLNMPNLGGMKLLEFVQQKNIQVPVALVSVTSDSRTIEEAYAKGAVGYLTKPIVPADFKERIEKIIDGR